MPIRAILLVTLLAVGLGLIVAGTALISTPAAFIVAGIGVLIFTALGLVEVS